MKLTIKKSLVERICRFFSHTREKVPQELQKAIDECSNMEELKELLFTCGFLNEVSMKAFDKRIEELERTS